MVRSITHFERLVVGAADEVAVTDIVGPRDLGVRLAREGVAFQPGKLCELAAEVSCNERSEVTSDFSLAFDYENISMFPTSGRHFSRLVSPIISHLV